MTESAPSSSLAELLALIKGTGGAQQYPVDQMLPSRQYGPPNQDLQPMPQGLPPNIMALWAAMTPQDRAQYLAATQRSMGPGASPQMASMAPQQPGQAPTSLSLSPALLAQFANLQPQVQYGDPMRMRPNNAVIDQLGRAQDMADLAYTGR